MDTTQPSQHATEINALEGEMAFCWFADGSPRTQGGIIGVAEFDGGQALYLETGDSEPRVALLSELSRVWVPSSESEQTWGVSDAEVAVSIAKHHETDHVVVWPNGSAGD